jgi:hypothetical protein
VRNADSHRARISRLRVLTIDDWFHGDIMCPEPFRGCVILDPEGGRTAIEVSVLLFSMLAVSLGE